MCEHEEWRSVVVLAVDFAKEDYLWRVCGCLLFVLFGYSSKNPHNTSEASGRAQVDLYVQFDLSNLKSTIEQQSARRRSVLGLLCRFSTPLPPPGATMMIMIISAKCGAVLAARSPPHTTAASCNSAN